MLQIMQLLPEPKKNIFAALWSSKRGRYAAAAVLDLILICLVILQGIQPAQRLLSPLISPMMPLKPITVNKSSREVFGFAPYWNIDKLDNVDFGVLTTFAYFGVEIQLDGNLDKEGIGYETFKSAKATRLFKEAHNHGTRVVLTLTQMKNGPILSLMDDPKAQQTAIDQAVKLVTDRGVDGINIDLEYSGDPGQNYRDKFTKFVTDLTNRMHEAVPGSKVTVSVYASAVKDPKIYDIASLSKTADGIFMMAYDFAVAGSDNAIPTAPLYGHSAGKYWYDISSAVDDFLKYMPSDKLILGVPYYGYNYLVYEPKVKAATRPWYSWRGKPAAQPYSVAKNNLKPDKDGIDAYREGWDSDGQVGYIAYHVQDTDTWRMIFLEDERSLGIKYDFAQNKKLAGVGMWALGNDEGKPELWDLLREKFGPKNLADRNISSRAVQDLNE